MSKQERTPPRRQLPELERDFARDPALGYEPAEQAGVIRCLAHGFPTPLARWHYHEEYEMHLITATSGKAFVGDWIGAFQPGHVVLAGPRLPHNWVSMDLDNQAVSERDLVIQFPHEAITGAAVHLPELTELLPLLARARHGIEFFGFGEQAVAHWQRVKASHGLARLAAFFGFMSALARWPDYRSLSAVQMQGDQDDVSLERINQIVDRLTHNLAQPMVAGDLAAELGMSESRFSRFFRGATGNTFTDFVNRVRINRACQLLMKNEQLVSAICYEAGFNNVANFNRRFLEIKGVTPSEFRRQSQQRFSGQAD